MKFVDGAERGLRIMLYGKTGTGKTLLASTVNRHPALSPAIFMNFDDGLISISHQQGVKQVQFDKASESGLLLSELRKPDDKRMPELRGIRTVILDSVTAFRDARLSEAIQNDIVRSKTVGKERTIVTPLIQDWGQTSFDVAAVVKGISDLGLNFVITAGENEIIVNDMLLRTEPLLNPKLNEVIGHMLDYIWRLSKTAVDKVDTSYKLQVIQRGPYFAKTRNPRFERELRQLSVGLAPEGVAEKDAEGFFKITLDGKAEYPEMGLDTFYEIYRKSVEYKENK